MELTKLLIGSDTDKLEYSYMIFFCYVDNAFLVLLNKKSADPIE